MRKTMIGLTAVLLTLGLFAGSALASTLNTAQLARKTACEAIDPGPNVVATYTAGTGTAGANDVCVVVSTATSYDESIEQVNNPRAAKAVNRVTRTESVVTTTQSYRWNTASVNANPPGQVWVASGDPVTEAETLVAEQCLQNPAREICE
jgi:hypothetical protein